MMGDGDGGGGLMTGDGDAGAGEETGTVGTILALSMGATELSECVRLQQSEFSSVSGAYS